jgi:hypothetical protein
MENIRQPRLSFYTLALFRSRSAIKLYYALSPPSIRAATAPHIISGS